MKNNPEEVNNISKIKSSVDASNSGLKGELLNKKTALKTLFRMQLSDK